MASLTPTPVIERLALQRSDIGACFRPAAVFTPVGWKIFAVARARNEPALARHAIAFPHDQHCKTRLTFRPAILVDPVEDLAKLPHQGASKTMAECHEHLRIAQRVLVPRCVDQDFAYFYRVKHGVRVPNGPQGRKGDCPPVATRPSGRMSEDIAGRMACGKQTL